jgi:thiol:disulfide interchange protein DsbD
VLGLQQGADAVLRLGLAMVLVAVAAWSWGRLVQRRASGRMPGALLMAIALVAGVLVLRPLLDRDVAPAVRAGDVAPPASVQWQPWSERAVAAARAQNKPVFVDFTAAWCISCQANKKLVLESEDVQRAFVQRGVVALRADWTRRDPEITQALAAMGRNGVPVYLVYRAGNAEPRVLPELLTSAVVIEAIGP